MKNDNWRLKSRVTSGKGRVLIGELWEEEKKGKRERAREKGRVTKDKWNVVIDELKMTITSDDWQMASVDWQVSSYMMIFASTSYGPERLKIADVLGTEDCVKQIPPAIGLNVEDCRRSRD